MGDNATSLEQAVPDWDSDYSPARLAVGANRKEDIWEGGPVVGGRPVGRVGSPDTGVKARRDG